MGYTVEFNLINNGYYSWLQNGFIRKEFRSLNLSSVGVKLLEENARRLAHKGLRLYVDKVTQKSRQIYLHWGFTFPKVEIIEFDFACDRQNGVSSPEADEDKINQAFLRG